MNRICGTCRYWVRRPSWQREQRGPCQKVMPGHAPDGMPFISTATAYTRLTTPRDFGCSLWEAQDE